MKKVCIQNHSCHLISVIVPVYNLEKYISRCIESIIHNTYKNLEIICIDDGSTDSSGKILDEFAEVDFRIIVVHQENAGVSAARNTGLERANGEFIAYIDADDYVHEKYFETLYQIATDYDADIALCRNGRAGDDYAFPAFTEINAQRLSVLQMMGDYTYKSFCTSKLYSRYILENMRFETNMSFSEDALYNLDLLIAHSSLKIVATTAVLYAYYCREGSLVTQYTYQTQMDLANQYLKRIAYAKNSEIVQIIAIETLKCLLSARYTSILVKDKRTYTKCNQLIKRTKKYLKAKKYFGYTILYHFPGIYRAIRVHKDKTLIVWEKNMKQSVEDKK